MAEKIYDTEYTEEMESSYLNYAMSVITDRALPSVLDGLKPVQRRVLYALSELTHASTPHRKSARIVGDCMGKYHPHGDSSIYEALVNLAQNWKIEIPLVDPHGNFGSIDGNGAAAMRYTEARISKYAEDVWVKDLPFCEEDFIPNFDNTEVEPTYLPFQIPNLLINGSSGIAVGMATSIPTHNLSEVIDATIAYINNNDISLEELLDIMPGPDFATGGIINASKEELLNVYASGRGKIKVRGKVEVRDIGHGRKSICVTEIPVGMIKRTSNFLEKCAELVRDKSLGSAIVDIADRGSKDGDCLCLDVKKGTSDEEIQNIIQILYKKTELEDSFSFNMNCIDSKGTPCVLGLKEVLRQYVEFKNNIYHKKYNKLLQKEQDNLEVKSGLITAVDCIDLIIEILRGSKKVADAKACLMHGDISNIKFRYEGSKDDAKLLNFTERQAEAILSMRLQKLIGLEVDLLKKEVANSEKLIKKYNKLLGNEKEMNKQMIEDMLEIKEKYGIPRRSVIKNYGEVVIKETKEAAMDVCILLDRFYYVKAVDSSVYEKNKESIDSDYRYHINCTTDDRICIFANNGNMYTIKVSAIVKLQSKKSVSKKKDSGIIGKLSDKGIQIFELCEMSGDENILFMDCTENILSNNNSFVFVSSNGYAKTVDSSIFDVIRKCINYCKPDEHIAYIGINADSDYLVAKTYEGYFIRVALDDIPKKGKTANGVNLISLNQNDFVEIAMVGNIKSEMIFNDVSIPFSKIKLGKRGNKGVKMRI